MAARKFQCTLHQGRRFVWQGYLVAEDEGAAMKQLLQGREFKGRGWTATAGGTCASFDEEDVGRLAGHVGRDHQVEDTVGIKELVASDQLAKELKEKAEAERKLRDFREAKERAWEAMRKVAERATEAAKAATPVGDAIRKMAKGGFIDIADLGPLTPAQDAVRRTARYTWPPDGEEACLNCRGAGTRIDRLVNGRAILVSCPDCHGSGLRDHGQYVAPEKRLGQLGGRCVSCGRPTTGGLGQCIRCGKQANPLLQHLPVVLVQSWCENYKLDPRDILNINHWYDPVMDVKVFEFETPNGRYIQRIDSRTFDRLRS